MHPSRWLLTSVVILALHAVPASAQFYNQTNLATGPSPDTDLVNPWGLTSGPTTPWWLADNGTDKSTLYTAAGVKITGLIVSVLSAPTGAVFNASDNSAPQFVLTLTNNPDGKTGKAAFIFDTEEGTILAWNNSAPSDKATVVFTAPEDPETGLRAEYKGLAIAQVDSTDPASWRLFATNFAQGRVDVFDGTFGPVEDPGFVDPTIPKGYSPFGIQTIDNTIYVTYALRNPETGDDVAGPGHGFVNAFDLQGNWIARVASGGPLNSPWGLAWASNNFGEFKGQLLVGNFGNGRIHAYALQANGTYELSGPLHSSEGPPLTIEGLWALQFGKGGNNGNDSQLFFTAGPDEESGGLFGFLTAAGPPGQNKK